MEGQDFFFSIKKKIDVFFENLVRLGSVEEYLKEVVTPLDEDDLTDSKGHKQCNCSR